MFNRITQQPLRCAAYADVNSDNCFNDEEQREQILETPK